VRSLSQSVAQHCGDRLNCDFDATHDEGAGGLDQRSWGCEIGETLVLGARQGFDVYTEGFVEDDDVVLVWTEFTAHCERRARRANGVDAGGWLLGSRCASGASDVARRDRGSPAAERADARGAVRVNPLARAGYPAGRICGT
jgi:hypothetical protein